jgi:hypothetical protein
MYFIYIYGTKFNSHGVCKLQVPTSCEVLLVPVCSLDSTSSKNYTSAGVLAKRSSL